MIEFIKLGDALARKGKGKDITHSKLSKSHKSSRALSSA